MTKGREVASREGRGEMKGRGRRGRGEEGDEGEGVATGEPAALLLVARVGGRWRVWSGKWG